MDRLYLTEENWPDWWRIVVITLKSKDLWNIVNDTEKIVAGADAIQQKAFRTHQFEAIRIIISPVSSSLDIFCHFNIVIWESQETLCQLCQLPRQCSANFDLFS